MPAKRKARERAPKRSKVAQDIISGLQEAVAFSRGEISLPVRLIFVPERVDVRKRKTRDL